MAWYTESGEMLDVVISTRVRFARNLAEYPFPAGLGGFKRIQLREVYVGGKK